MKSAVAGAALGLMAVLTAILVARYHHATVTPKEFAARWEVLKSEDGKSTIAWRVTMTEKEFIAFANFTTDTVAIDKVTHDRINKAIRVMVEQSGLAMTCPTTYDMFLRDPRMSIAFVGLCNAHHAAPKGKAL